MNTSFTAVAALATVLGVSATTAHADRAFRASTGIMVSASSDGQGHVVSVDPVLFNEVDGTVRNLSGTVTIFVNDVPVITALYIYNVASSISSGCVPSFCDGFCPDPSQFCQPFRPGYPCGCYINTERVVSPPIVLHIGDVITAQLAAIPGAEPEEFPDNDTISMTFTGSCAADFDEDGTHGVPDIFAFLSAWFAQDISADVDGVPGVAVPDIFAFLSIWFAGC